jgi:hypothetical protein
LGEPTLFNGQPDQRPLLVIATAERV